MNSFEFELWIEQYKAIIKKTGERSLFPDEMTRLDSNIDAYMPEEYKEAYNLAKEGNYSMFETLPHLLRNYLGAKALKEFRDEFGETPSLDDEGVRQYLEKNAMNAALRAGISAEKNAIPHRGDAEKIITEKDAEETRKYAKALDSYMNGILMKRTMLPPTEEAKSHISEQLNNEEQVEAAIERNKAKQLVMAKTMLLAQLGKYDVVSKNGLSSELEVPVYETLVHGNRTNFVLPVGEDSQAVLEAFVGPNGGAGAGIEKRTAATHFVKRRAVDKNGVIRSDIKESKTFNPLKVFNNQYGMDIAVGGIGTKGPDSSVITDTGEAGHVYMRLEKGDAKHCGSLMIGIEGSAPGKSSYLGNSHGITAKSAKQSAFLADKAIVGKKVGGRQVDLSGISATDLSELLSTFSQKYTELQNSANTPDGLEKLAKVNDMLMGKHMNVKELIGFFDKLDMAGERTNALLAQARKGYLSGVKANEVTKDRFEQSIRKGFSQEMACELAEARFVQSTDLAHSVGAIKELMLTHETRSLRWKLCHPIKNYRENAKISDLTKRLKDEKGYNSIQIANEFVRESNSFEMDWGKSLSNDRDALRFEQENKQHFLPAESMLLGVLKENYRDQIKEATPQNESSLKMKAELQKVFEQRTNKEQIAKTEESEKNKTTQKTSEPMEVKETQNHREHIDVSQDVNDKVVEVSKPIVRANPEHNITRYP